MTAATAATAATVAAVSSFSPDPPHSGRLARPLGRAAAAALGALLLWALAPLFAVRALAVPPFLLLAIAFAAAFLVAAVRCRRGGKPMASLFAARPHAAAGLLGLIGAALLWLLALRSAFPADTASLATPWPVLDAAFGALIGRLPAAHGPVGYVFALAGAVCWAASARARRRRAGSAADAMGGSCGIAAPICLFLHLCLEPRLPLDMTGLAAAVALGLGPLGLAVPLWERAGRPDAAGRLSAVRRRGAAGR